jgi:hypothetical protein
LFELSWLSYLQNLLKDILVSIFIVPEYYDYNYDIIGAPDLYLWLSPKIGKKMFDRSLKGITRQSFLSLKYDK